MEVLCVAIKYLLHACSTTLVYLFSEVLLLFSGALTLAITPQEGMTLTRRNGLMAQWCCSAQLGGRVSFFSAVPMSLWQYLSSFSSLWGILVSELPEPLSFVVIWDLSLSAFGHGMLVMSSKKRPKGA